MCSVSESETLSVLRDLVALSRDDGDFSCREWYPVWVRARAVVDKAAPSSLVEVAREDQRYYEEHPEGDEWEVVPAVAQAPASWVDRVAEAAFEAHLVSMYGELPSRPGWWDSLDLETKQTWRAAARAAAIALSEMEITHKLRYRAGTLGFGHIGIMTNDQPRWYCTCGHWCINRDLQGHPFEETAKREHRKHVKEFVLGWPFDDSSEGRYNPRAGGTKPDA